jgi:hypothetical protein
VARRGWQRFQFRRNKKTVRPAHLTPAGKRLIEACLSIVMRAQQVWWLNVFRHLRKYTKHAIKTSDMDVAPRHAVAMRRRYNTNKV